MSQQNEYEKNLIKFAGSWAETLGEALKFLHQLSEPGDGSVTVPRCPPRRNGRGCNGSKIGPNPCRVCQAYLLHCSAIRNLVEGNANYPFSEDEDKRGYYWFAEYSDPGNAGCFTEFKWVLKRGGCQPYQDLESYLGRWKQ